MSDVMQITNPQIHHEWVAWRNWCAHFTKTTGIDINHDCCKEMVEAVKNWGEELAALRIDQPEDTRNKALMETRVAVTPMIVG